jgi:hypothetical protein
MHFRHFSYYCRYIKVTRDANALTETQVLVECSLVFISTVHSLASYCCNINFT